MPAGDVADAPAPQAPKTAQEAFSGKCPCGKLAVTLSPRDGQELRVGYCHCFSCRRFYSAPVTLEVVITDAKPGDGFTIEGEHVEDTRTYPSHTTVRMRCAGCQVPVATKWKFEGLSGDWGWEFPVMLFNTAEEDGLPAGFPKPARHSWYSTRIIDVKDGLPKWGTWEGFSDKIDE